MKNTNKTNGRAPIARLIKDNMAASLFIVPSFAGVALFYIVPFIMSIGYAAADADGRFVGMANFIGLLSSEAFRLAAGNTAKFMAVAIPLNIAVPLAIAYMLFKAKGGG